MADPPSCPSRDELQQMVLGQLPDLTAKRIQLHLERCPKCCSALDECVASRDFLEALRASGWTSSELTKTMDLPIECIRGALSTWTHGNDSTRSASRRPFSMAEINRQLSPPQAADEIGRLGDFRVLRVLGAGGFAVVFEAEDSRLKRRVALKLMHPAIADKRGGADRFLREAQSAAALKHEHVVTIYQVGVADERTFIALELLHGETLEDYLVRKGRLSLGEVLRIGREIASGLAAAHARGLLHRDIKPANIWLEGPETPAAELRDQPANDQVAAGKVKILDFGCAKSWADEVAISDHGLLIGTPAYMAPEQFSGEAVDPRTDLFCLGCVLYRMAAGRRPFAGDNVFSMVRALALDDPKPLAAVDPQVPRSLSNLVGKLLSKSLQDRPATAQAVVGELRAIEREVALQQLTETATTAKSSDFGHRSWRQGGRGQRKKWAVGTGIGLAALLAVLFVLFGGQLIRIATNKGQVVIEVDDPDVTVQVQENQIAIHDGKGRAEITLGSGDHQLDVTLKQPTGDITFKTDEFTLRRGDKKVIEVRRDLAEPVASLTPRLPKTPDARSSGAATTEGQLSSASDPDRSVASWVLSQGGSVRIRVGGSERPVRPGNALPQADFQLTAVDLQSRPLTDADLTHFRGLKHLEELSLGGKQIAGPGLKNLAALTDLKTLVLWNTSVTDGALEPIEGLTKLETLCLDGASLTDAGLAHLAPLKNLRQLNINAASLSGTGLTQLAGLTRLESLYLRGNSVTDVAAVHLGDLTNLQTLCLSGQPLSDAALAPIGRLRKLQVLELDSTKLTDSALVHFKRLNRLRELNLSWTHFTDAGLKQLAEKLPQLESLYLRGNYLSDAGLVHLGGFKKLATLYLSGQPVTDAGLTHILKLEQLMGLGLSSTRVTDAGFANLSALKNLRNLNLEQTRVTDAVLPHLKGLPQLEDLALGGTRVTDAGLAELQKLDHLRTLSLRGITPLTDSVVPQLVKVRSLKEIDLSDTRITAKGYAALRAGLPGLNRIVWTDATAAAAKAVLAAGGTVQIRLQGAERTVKAIAELPTEPFQIASVSLAGARPPFEPVLTALSDPRVDDVVSLELSGTAINDGDWLRLKKLTHLRRLVLEGNTLSESDLARLGELTNLEDLSLHRAQFNEAGLFHLRGLTRLTTLAINRTQLTDAGLAHLADLKTLKDLNLNNTAVSDAGLKHLAGMTDLRNLVLESTRVSDAGLKELVPLKKLESLWLGFGTRVTNAGFVWLSQMKNLRVLALPESPITDEGLARLKELPQLETLWIPGRHLTDAGLVHLRGLSKLRVLSLGHQPVTDAGLANLQSLVELRRLDLPQTRLTDAGLAQLKGLSHLEVLDVSETRVTQAALDDVEAFKNLRVLNLQGLPGIGDTAVPRILHLKGLRSLDLRETHVSLRGFDILKSSSPGLTITWSEPNVRTARAIIAAGGYVAVRLEQSGSEVYCKAPGELPTQSFQITRARLVRSSRPTLNELLSALANPRIEGLMALNLASTAIEDADLERIKPLTALQQLNLENTRITDAGLASLKGLTALKLLILDGDAIRGPGLMHLRELPELAELRLGCPELTQLFLVELAGLKKLDRLSLTKSSFADEGVSHVAQLTRLKELDVRGTQVTSRGVAKLQMWMPQCRIITSTETSRLATP